jgi:hypothetical protein
MKRSIIMMLALLLVAVMVAPLNVSAAGPVQAYVVMTQRPDRPQRYVNLREKPRMDSFSLGGFYDGAPVIVLDGSISTNGDSYERVLVGSLEAYNRANGAPGFPAGYIQAKYLKLKPQYNLMPRYSMPGGHMMTQLYQNYPDGYEAEGFSVEVLGFMMLPVWYVGDGDGKKDDQPPDGRWYVRFSWEYAPEDRFGFWDAMQPARIQ